MVKRMGDARDDASPSKTDREISGSVHGEKRPGRLFCRECHSQITASPTCNYPEPDCGARPSLLEVSMKHFPSLVRTASLWFALSIPSLAKLDPITGAV